MTSTDLDFDRVKALLRSPFEANQRVGLALLYTLGVPNDKELVELICDTSNKIMWCQEFNLAEQVSVIKLDNHFHRRNISLAPFVNLEKLHFNRQTWNRGQIPFKLFSKLKTISLTGNQIWKFPTSITTLKHLEILYLGKNQLLKLPNEIGRLSSLKVLILSKNKLRKLPSHLVHLNQLQNLNLANNRLHILPTDLGLLHKLEILNLSCNLLEEIPASIGQLRQLKILNLTGNKLSHLPNEIQNLTQLESLYLNNNSIIKNKRLMNRLSLLLPNTTIYCTKKIKFQPK